jgi:uncharacterized protein YeaO (DUF488 family)
MDIEIKLKRVYDAAEESDGMRVLVDRLWPRGIRKDNLKYDLWAKEITPSPTLRKLFHEDVDNNWDVFTSGYEEELEHSEAFKEFINMIKKEHPECVTLLFAFKNCIKNHAIILRQEIIKHLSE